jgi:hypothetical protein
MREEGKCYVPILSPLTLIYNPMDTLDEEVFLQCFGRPWHCSVLQKEPLGWWKKEPVENRILGG